MIRPHHCRNSLGLRYCSSLTEFPAVIIREDFTLCGRLPKLSGSVEPAFFMAKERSGLGCSFKVRHPLVESFSFLLSPNSTVTTPFAYSRNVDSSTRIAVRACLEFATTHPSTLASLGSSIAEYHKPGAEFFQVNYLESQGQNMMAILNFKRAITLVLSTVGLVALTFNPGEWLGYCGRACSF